jgi:hemolysin activation/secretion protein
MGGVRLGFWRGVLLAAAAAMTSAGSAAFAQVLPYNIGDAVRESDQSRRAAPQPRVGAGPVLPTLVDPPFTLKDKEKLLVRSFQVEGPGLIEEAQVRAILSAYEGRQLTLTEIYEAADKVTTLYRNAGYLVAKAYVPAQNAGSGVLRLKIVPGKFGDVTLKNASLVRDSVLKGIMDQALAGSTYIHKDPIERAMLLMSDLPGAGMPRIAIGAGRVPETSDFVFDAGEGRRADGYVLGDNYGSPFTGRNRLSGGFNLNSPFGFGDRLSAYGLVSDTQKLVNGRVAYSAPVGYSGLRAEVSAFRTTYALGGIYQPLEASGTADGVTAALTYPLKRQRDESIYLSGNYTYKLLNDNLLGESLARRTIGVGTIAATRETSGTIFGITLLTGATLSFSAGNVNFSDPEQRQFNIDGVNTVGDFSKVNLLLSSTIGLSERLSLVTNFRAQKSLSGNLDSSEQIGLTGVWGVRSFDEGLAADTGYVVTPELKYALPGLGSYSHAVSMFADVGEVWIENPTYLTTQKWRTQLSDVGLGYYAAYEYSPGRSLLLKAHIAQTFGSNDGARSYDKQTKGLLQVGFTF